MTQPSRSIRTFAEFWPFYVGQHRRPGTRVLHFLGTTAGILWLAAAVGFGHPSFVLFGLVSAYGLAWIGHFFIERNRPATLTYPVWSFLGDFKMYGLMARGKMTAEVERLGLIPAAAPRTAETRSSAANKKAPLAQGSLSACGSPRRAV